MIIDSHAYCFLPADDPRGYGTAGEHLRSVQASHALHHQPAWRVRDRGEAESTVLAPEGIRDLSALPDVDFRVDHQQGRVIWTIDGEDYTKQFYPPNLRHLEFTPHSLISEMDFADVDGALLHVDPMLVRDSSFVAECVAEYPQRLRGMALVDERRIADDPDQVIQELNTAITVHGLHAIKFHTPVAYGRGPEPWDDGPYRSFWQSAASLGVPVFFTMGCGPISHHASASKADLRSGYLDELNTLVRWMERYPQTVCSLTHGFHWRLYLEGDRLVVNDERLWEPFQNPNCNVEVCFAVRIGDVFDYPYTEARTVLEQMVEHVGADHLLWGTDMPFQNRFCTYRQSRAWIEKYCTFLTPDDRAAIMGGTAARILGWK